MHQLSQAFLDSCARQNGRILRGEHMTRVETFVDAAFAFAFTMLVISIDEMPRNVAELMMFSQDIPAFILSAAVIGMVWVAHTSWSRTFGLHDGVTLALSLGLVMLVLIFVYPIKLMVQITLMYYSGADMGSQGIGDVATLFVYFGLGLIALSFIIIGLYQNLLRLRQQLLLSEYEVAFCKMSCMAWGAVTVTALLSCLLAPFSVEFSGWAYFLIGPSIVLSRHFYGKRLGIKRLQQAS